ncbi:HupE/UreJ family protein [Methylobacterium sp. WSM2598]|uniref:HupE/UreJ family protein n=1 Tax=Methylobacterium sp. WSM2598 TaxID=398261 RepID=UPI000370FB81|nr:HupE/UreJ family protein [Methylobacterium sp. WSM2598]
MLARLCAVAACLGLLSVIGGSASSAHEVRPAYLELREEAPGLFDVLLKTPMRGDLRLALRVSFSGEAEPLSPVVSRRTDGAMVQTWRVRAKDGLSGQSVRLVGLESTVSDALLRVSFADGRSFAHRLTPAAPQATIAAAQSGIGVARTYLSLGIEHILLGFDHLLFVLGLILVTDSTRRLLWAITAFTAAHSITLSAAALGVVHVPPKPVEAVIALSIVFVAVEIIRARGGRPGLAAQAPWLVAFAFGLLHGFGFAGALSEIGMPAGHIPVALLLFNLGVEAGQLLFVGAVLALAVLLRRLGGPLPHWTQFVPPYLIGSVAMFWVIQRVAQF